MWQADERTVMWKPVPGEELEGTKRRMDDAILEQLRGSVDMTKMRDLLPLAQLREFGLVAKAQRRGADADVCAQAERLGEPLELRAAKAACVAKLESLSIDDDLESDDGGDAPRVRDDDGDAVRHRALRRFGRFEGEKDARVAVLRDRESMCSATASSSAHGARLGALAPGVGCDLFGLCSTLKIKPDYALDLSAPRSRAFALTFDVTCIEGDLLLAEDLPSSTFLIVTSESCVLFSKALRNGYWEHAEDILKNSDPYWMRFAAARLAVRSRAVVVVRENVPNLLTHGVMDTEIEYMLGMGYDAAFYFFDANKLKDEALRDMGCLPHGIRRKRLWSIYVLASNMYDTNSILESVKVHLVNMQGSPVSLRSALHAHGVDTAGYDDVIIQDAVCSLDASGPSVRGDFEYGRQARLRHGAAMRIDTLSPKEPALRAICGVDPRVRLDGLKQISRVLADCAGTAAGAAIGDSLRRFVIPEVYPHAHLAFSNEPRQRGRVVISAPRADSA